jgi:hypothetical protein
MTTIAIEINDVGLEAASDSGLLGSASPGYALLDRRRVVAGEPAFSQARLRPRFISHRHWDLLNRQPAGRPFPRGLSHADLVHSHLSQYWGALLAAAGTTTARTSVLLALPASYSHEQLSLLLGITRAAGIPVTGLVDAALAAMASSDLEGPTLHLDIRLHRAVWTVIEPTVVEPRVRRTGTETVEAAGLQAFRQSWVRCVAERFVRETRLDPLHRGATEQALYDRLDDWAAQVESHGSATLAIDDESQGPTIEVSSAQLAEAAQEPLEAIVETARCLLGDQPDRPIHVSARVAGIPGLVHRISELSTKLPIHLPVAAGAHGAIERRAAIESPGNELRLITELPPGPSAAATTPVLEPYG